MDKLNQAKEKLMDVRSFDLGASPSKYRYLFAKIQDIKSKAKQLLVQHKQELDPQARKALSSLY